MLQHVYKKVIMDHCRAMRNFHELEGRNVIKTNYKNPTCGDVMSLFLELHDNKVEDISFLGEGCAISMASASMMTELIKYKSLDDVIEVREAFEKLIRTGETENDEMLGESISLQGVHALKARHNCALMAWQALDKALRNVEE